VAGFGRPGATYPWLYRKSVPFHVGGTSIRYRAAPMLPVSNVGVGDGLAAGLGDGVAPVDDEQPASSAAMSTTRARLTEMKPRPPSGKSDVGSRLPAIYGDACTVQEACLLRADERDDIGHLTHGAEPA
jgi:hypothetical protein